MVPGRGLEQVEGQTNRKRAAYCNAASAALGARRDTIRFRIRCAGPASGGDARFVVERYLPRDPDRMRGPHLYPGILEVREGSGKAERARCTVRQRILECQAEISGSVILGGAYSVERQTACGLSVSMIEVRAKPCDRGGCQGSLRVRELFNGRPRGC